MIHPDTEIRFVSEKIGVGVFATRLLRKGTIAWLQDDLDMQISETQFMSLDPLRRDVIVKYAYMGNGGHHVLCWDHGRYLNHSSFPNLAPTAYGIELCARDILPGEELRCDYATYYAALGEDAPFECAPEQGTFRMRVTSDDYLYLYKQWDDMAREAFARVNLVSQPLRHLIRPDLVDEVSAIAAGLAAPKSWLALHQK
jgi:hypothetical protein